MTVVVAMYPIFTNVTLTNVNHGSVYANSKQVIKTDAWNIPTKAHGFTDEMRARAPDCEP